MIFKIYVQFPIRMMMSPNSTHVVRLGFVSPGWSLDYVCDLFWPLNNHSVCFVSYCPGQGISHMHDLIVTVE